MIEDKLDITENTQLFFKTWDIPERKLTLEDREFLEEILMEDGWDLTYIKDQWCGLDAVHNSVNWDNMELAQECFDKDIEYQGPSVWDIDYKFRGEGESPTECLLAVYTLVYPHLEQETIDWIKENLKGKDNGTSS